MENLAAAPPRYLDAVTKPTPSTLARPARVLGPVDATCVVIGAIVGVGIFITPGQVAATTGSGGLALLAWALGGVLAIFGAFVFAELGGMFTGDGAQYTIVRDGYGPLPGFLFVFCMATIIQPGTIAIIALTCTDNLLFAANHAGAGLTWRLTLAALLIVLLTGANVFGVRAGARIQNLTVLAKVLALVAVTALAVFASPSRAAVPVLEHEASPLTPTVAVMAALVPVLFTFGGWQQVMWIAGEVRDPKRTLPRAIIGGVVMVIAVYMAANWAYLDLLGFDAVRASKTIAADAVAAVYPTFGGRLAAGAVAVSAFGVLNANLLTGPRLVYGLARDGRFLSVFARLSPRFGTPASSIVLIAAGSLMLLVSLGQDVIDTLVSAVVLVDVVFFVLTVGALFIFRKTRKDAERPMRCPGYPVVPVLFILGELGALAAAFYAMRNIALISAGWIVAGVIVYLLFFRTRITAPAR
jgi:APA family basic amino acid/polyamine antiporter